MIYKRGHRYTLKRKAIQLLLAGSNTLAQEHDKLLDQGFAWPRISVSDAPSGLATIRATWKRRIADGNVTHRLTIYRVRLA
jgi:hypothetical protein